MSIVVKHQIEASEHAVAEIENEIDHRNASLCYEVESLLQGLVANLHGLNDLVESGRCSTKRGEAYFDTDSLREMELFYRRLDAAFTRADGIVKLIESSSGYKITGKETFYLAWSELQGIVCFSLDRISAAHSEAGRGEGRDLKEVVNELLH